jgi:hypothetical protein
MKFIVEFDTGHAPMLHSTEIAAGLRQVSDLVEPWGKVAHAPVGRVIKLGDKPVGEWKVIV